MLGCLAQCDHVDHKLSGVIVLLEEYIYIYICRYCYVAARLSLRTLLSHMTVATQCHAHAFRDAEFVTPKATGVLL